MEEPDAQLEEELLLINASLKTEIQEAEDMAHDLRMHLRRLNSRRDQLLQALEQEVPALPSVPAPFVLSALARKDGAGHAAQGAKAAAEEATARARIESAVSGALLRSARHATRAWTQPAPPCVITVIAVLPGRGV